MDIAKPRPHEDIGVVELGFDGLFREVEASGDLLHRKPLLFVENIDALTRRGHFFDQFGDIFACEREVHHVVGRVLPPPSGSPPAARRR